jgi:hypothetical protein
MIDTFAIPLTFIIIATLALWIIVGSKGWWLLKAATIVVVSVFCVFLWRSLDDLQGWPTNDPIPNKFEVKWITVNEPNKKTDSPGAIYVWLKDLEPEKTSHSWYLTTKHKNVNDEPRLHKMPYTRERHEQAMKIQAKIGKGGKFMAQKSKGGIGEGSGQHKGPKGQSKGKGKGGGGMSEGGDEFKFYELPPPSYPEKVLE